MKETFCKRTSPNFKLLLILVYNIIQSEGLLFQGDTKMAQFAIEIADEDVARVLGAVAANYNRPEKVANPDYDPNAENPVDELIDNPETLPQFANRIVRQFLAEHVTSYEVRSAKEAAAAAADTAVNIFDPQA
jgi:hypothetical protein|tara:strand:- start:1370 stop:1768 length:399 start_codon:yes stop_codon:yes gene_type:complete